MRILVTGSRMFHAGYRVDRALVRASAKQHDMCVLTVGQWRDGAERMARDMARDFGWVTERVHSVSEARADLCCAFLHRDDDRTDESRIIVLKAEKAGIPVWRYYEGGPRQPHPEPGVPLFTQDMVDDMVYPGPESALPWEELLERLPDEGYGTVRYRIESIES